MSYSSFTSSASPSSCIPCRRSVARLFAESARQHDRRIGRHGIGRAAHLSGQGPKWQKAWRDVRTGSATALTDSTVTQGAAVGHVNTLPIGRIGYRPGILRVCRHHAHQGNRQEYRERTSAHRLLHQRPCETTSTSAGSPRLSTATAFFSAGPRSLGSVIGPKDSTPRPLATIA